MDRQNSNAIGYGRIWTYLIFVFMVGPLGIELELSVEAKWTCFDLEKKRGEY